MNGPTPTGVAEAEAEAAAAVANGNEDNDGVMPTGDEADEEESGGVGWERSRGAAGSLVRKNSNNKQTERWYWQMSWRIVIHTVR